MKLSIQQKQNTQKYFKKHLKNARRKTQGEYLSAYLDSIQRELDFKKYSLFSDWRKQQAQLEFDSRVKEPIPPIRVELPEQK
jgi:hypothetical protein